MPYVYSRKADNRVIAIGVGIVDHGADVAQTQVTDAQYAVFAASPWENGIFDPIAKAMRVMTPAELLTDIQKAKEAEIRKACAAALDAVVAPYLEQERETWETELAEATAWQANNAAPTRFIDRAITASQALYTSDTKAAYVNEILTKAGTYKDATGDIIGRRRGLLKKIYDPAATVASVQAIVW